MRKTLKEHRREYHGGCNGFLLYWGVMTLVTACSSTTVRDDGSTPADRAIIKEIGGGDGSSPKRDTNGLRQESSIASRRIFTTRSTYPGDLKSAGAGSDGLQGADRLCTQAAEGAQLVGSWKAWISTKTVNAIDRIADQGPWYSISGEKIFSDKEMLKSSPVMALWWDEQGKVLTSDRIWTGTISGGMVSPLDETCQDWTSSKMEDLAKIGQVGRMDGAAWTSFSSTTCNQQAHLICLEQ